MAKKIFKVKFATERAKDEIKDLIRFNLDVVKEKKKSFIIKAKNMSKVEDTIDKCIEEYNCGRYWGDIQGGTIGGYNIKELDEDIDR